jgi:hypothetical protein
MESDRPTVRLARALADPTRIRIAALLVERTLTLDQIVSELGLRPQEVTRHLTLLIESRLVAIPGTSGPTGYRLDLDELRRISRHAFATERAPAPSIDGDDREQKIVRDFVKEGRLTTIPSSHKKKLVILRWLASQLPSDTKVPERELNVWLQQFHPDFATLRRELVDNHFLARERGIYWRVDDVERS